MGFSEESSVFSGPHNIERGPLLVVHVTSQLLYGLLSCDTQVRVITSTYQTFSKCIILWYTYMYWVSISITVMIYSFLRFVHVHVHYLISLESMNVVLVPSVPGPTGVIYVAKVIEL